DPKDFEVVKKALESQDIKSKNAEITKVPKSTVKLTGDAAKQIIGLVEALEDHDDVQNVYANFDVPDEVL
ncbi:MAG: YebC/PmpR family DNA-binding transcriptional regulator, partial [Candidatus Omnitrophota bacterium]|nr:YebC/PmpR family DNA-binding transcriptional regulator [Candidatus Omnitrophota bacterium]